MQKAHFGPPVVQKKNPEQDFPPKSHLVQS